MPLKESYGKIMRHLIILMLLVISTPISAKEIFSRSFGRKMPFTDWSVVCTEDPINDLKKCNASKVVVGDGVFKKSFIVSLDYDYLYYNVKFQLTDWKSTESTNYYKCVEEYKKKDTFGAEEVCNKTVPSSYADLRVDKNKTIRRDISVSTISIPVEKKGKLAFEFKLSNGKEIPKHPNQLESEEFLSFLKKGKKLYIRIYDGIYPGLTEDYEMDLKDFSEVYKTYDQQMKKNSII